MKVKVEGLRDVERALKQLPRATAKASARRILKEAGEPIARAGAANAPQQHGDLAESYGVGTKLTKRQRKVSRRESDVEVYVGPNDPGAVQTEFGNDHQSAQPHLRPAWDGHRMGALETIKSGIWGEVTKTIARYQKRMAKKGAKQ
ncbi:MAG TPA: hypothetical protein DIT40_05980 [Alphaproteobacteria bacterium]|nr:hypothetical protein [Alphaproteobacteria bacterium]